MFSTCTQMYFAQSGTKKSNENTSTALFFFCNINAVSKFKKNCQSNANAGYNFGYFFVTYKRAGTDWGLPRPYVHSGPVRCIQNVYISFYNFNSYADSKIIIYFASIFSR